MPVPEKGDFNLPRRPKFSGWLGADFLKLWVASSCSSLGDGIMLAAGPLLLSSITSDPALVAGAVVVQQIPWVLFSLPARRLYRPVDRKALVTRVNLIRGSVLGALAALIAFHLAGIVVIYAALLLLGVCEVLADNAYSTLVPMAVPERRSPAGERAPGRYLHDRESVRRPGARRLYIHDRHRIPVCRRSDLRILSRWSSSSSSGGRMTYERNGRRRRESVRADIAEGLRWMRNAPSIRVLAITLSIMNITFMAAFSLLVLLARERLGVRGTGFGLLLAVSAVGGLARRDPRGAHPRAAFADGAAAVGDPGRGGRPHRLEPGAQPFSGRREHGGGIFRVDGLGCLGDQLPSGVGPSRVAGPGDERLLHGCPGQFGPWGAGGRSYRPARPEPAGSSCSRA